MPSLPSHRDIIQHMVRLHGPIREGSPMEIDPETGIALHVIPPRDAESPIVAFTTGMSDSPQSVPTGREAYRYTELFMLLRGDCPLDPESQSNPNFRWPFEWLLRAAAYPRLEDTWLGGPYTILSNGEPPEPFAPGTTQSCLLLLREPDDDGTVRLGDGREVLLYSMFPLFTEERDLEKRAGMRELLAGFQRHGLGPWVDPKRANTAAR